MTTSWPRKQVHNLLHIEMSGILVTGLNAWLDSKEPALALWQVCIQLPWMLSEVAYMTLLSCDRVESCQVHVCISRLIGKEIEKSAPKSRT